MSIRNALIVLVFVSVVPVGCESTAQPEYEDISGIFTGPVSGSGSGYSIQGSFSLSISQSEGSLSGTYSTSVTVQTPAGSVPFAGSGTISGVIEAGADPKVEVVVQDVCNAELPYIGAFNSASRTLSASGPFPLYDGCNPVATLTLTITLSKT